MTDSPFFTRLENRSLIHIEGPDRHTFLQGLITNDIKKLKSGELLYACLLNAQGKFLHDFFIHEGEDMFLIDCEGGERAADLYRRLSMYRLRADVQISVEDKIPVYAIIGSDQYGLKDPRHEDMGYRSFDLPCEASAKQGKSLLPEKPFAEWDRHRIKLVIPDGSRDLIPEKSTMDEAHMDQLNAIDYDKGCYVGQELTARMHYRGLGKKHLKMVEINNLPEKAELRSSCGDIGLALVRN